ncbi:MAG: competence/damage-inducible protein A [Bacteroidota bacterium]|nr:competence/damage-inducible protein A [Bacteroidota bacterium]
MRAEIITIGDELLLGQVIDTNSAWIGQILFKNNIQVAYKTTISDQKSAIDSQLNTSLERSDLIVITGGLGPTKDDITKITLAQYFNMGWRIDQKVVQNLEKIFEKKSRKMLEINVMQAEMPDGCETLYNEWGTAPGMWFEHHGKIIISLPGVPYEMKNIFEFKALPKIREKFKTEPLFYKTMVTFNIPESLLAIKIKDVEESLPAHISLAYLPNLNVVRLRLTGKMTGQLNIKEEINHFANQIKDLIGDAIVAEEDLTMSEIISGVLKSKHLSLSVAESCTGGLLSHQLTMLPGASQFFVGSVISYSNSVKHHQLGVESTLFETVGAVSEQVVEQMVNGVREKLKTDYAIALSGVAGPGGGSEEKPVGTVVIGICSDKETIVKRFHFIGDRHNVILRSSNMAFDMLRRLILGLEIE